MPGNINFIEPDVALKTLSYGPHPEQFGQLHRPATETRLPVMVIVHGGYWKDNHNLNSYATQAIVEHFKSKNIVVWNLEYRRMESEGENTLAPWPAILEDIALGMDFLQNIASGEKLDLNRILMVGHSAGGHLAMWAAGRAQLPHSSSLFRQQPLVPTRVISIAGILDLGNSQYLSQPEQVARMIGGSPERFPERYAIASPAQCPHPSVPTIIVQGGQDRDVPPQQAEAYLQASNNPNLHYIFMRQADHFSMLPLEGVEPGDWKRLTQIIQKEIDSL